MYFRLSIVALCLIISGLSCRERSLPADAPVTVAGDSVLLVVLGVAQDGGAPHIGCLKKCCADLRVSGRRHPVVSLGLVDRTTGKSWLFEATPDLPQQVEELRKFQPFPVMPDGIFLTHAHIGHYSGLMYLGREAISARQVPVFAMPKMKSFIENNGPWSQLVQLNNIALKLMKQDSAIELSPDVRIVPFTVPHRDEYSETIGFVIHGKRKKALFVPDIDKWDKWDRDIVEMIRQVDFAFIDATFYNNNEVPGRDISEIPHPFVTESMDRFKSLGPEEKGKIYFIHFNHTNPLLDERSEAFRQVTKAGYHVAVRLQTFSL